MDDFDAWKYKREHPNKPWMDKKNKRIKIVWTIILGITAFLFPYFQILKSPYISVKCQLIIVTTLPVLGILYTIKLLIGINKPPPPKENK
jgi:hypothetical protein